MSLKADFVARFPEFGDDPSGWSAVENAWQCYYPKEYEGCTKEIILNLIAHLLWFNQQQGGGSIKSQASRSVDGVSVSFGSATSTGNNRDFFGFTKYGQAFLFLTKSQSSKAFFL